MSFQMPGGAVAGFVVSLAALVAMSALAQGAAVTWDEAQGLKVSQLKQAAANAVAQQRVTSYPPAPLPAAWSGVGGATVEESKAWDVDGDGLCRRVTLRAIPANSGHVAIADRLQVRFPGPVNLLEKSTGFAFWVKADDGLSKDLRIGVHFKVEGSDQDPIVISDIPLVQKFGDNPQQIYIDWGYVFDHSVTVFKVPPRAFFTRVTGFDLTIVQKRLPRDQVKLDPVGGGFCLDGLQLVDWYDGSYDSDRFPKDGPINMAQTMVSQGRTQQVAHICAKFGGEAGLKSALRAMDMMSRIQCWDGSWPEMATRLQGEFTHGMILADLAAAYAELKRLDRPELKEPVEIRQWKMTRGALYEQMLYRAGLSRSPAPISGFVDTYCSGPGALASGCNRPMIFVLSQYVAAQVLSSPAQRRQLLGEYEKNMGDLVAAQGATAGGWPIFGEGNAYQGRGLHWDCGYTTDHVYIMSLGSRITGDQRWGAMMKKFGAVVEAMALPNGYEIDGALSERGQAKSGGLKAPDLVFQEAQRWGAIKLAQWAANSSAHLWSNWPTGMWAYASSARGYGLGAFLTWQVYDMQAAPRPQGLGLVFPRQWPIWSARWLDKRGQEVRRSRVTVRPDGSMLNSFAWEIGQYPVLSAVPLAVKVEGGAVEIEPTAYTGNTARLPATVHMTLIVESDGQSQPSQVLMPDDKFSFEVAGPVRVRLKFAEDDDTELAFTVKPQAAEPVGDKVGEKAAEPGEKAGEQADAKTGEKAAESGEKAGSAVGGAAVQKVRLDCRLLRKPEPYVHNYPQAAPPEAAPRKGRSRLAK